jgi:hypothetical protein
MQYAAILNAEGGWKAVLVRRDGTVSIVQIARWGSTTATFSDPAPLSSYGEDLRAKKNFVLMLNPNYPMTDEQIASAAKRKARELRWID